MYSSSSAEEAVEEEGSESISSMSEELVGGSMKLALLLIDMAAVVSNQAVNDSVREDSSGGLS